MRALTLLFALVAPLLASTPDSIRRGLASESRGAREAAEQAARELARTDPAALGALWDGLDAMGRRVLARALASAGTRHAAMVALQHAGKDESPEVFRALLSGLAAGGRRSLFVDLAPDLAPARRRAIEELRLRWRVEGEFVRLKSPAGSTGSFTGQFAAFRPLGPGVIPILFDLVLDRAVPLPGEASEGPYATIHPEMVRFDRYELRELAAHGFGEIARKDDAATIARLQKLCKHFRELEDAEYDWEREQLAPALAFSLFDLGDPAPVELHIRDLEERERGRDYDSLRAKWALGYALIRIGRYAEGEEKYQEILSLPDGAVSRDIAAYNLACNFASRARKDPKRRALFKRYALDYLETAIRLNWWDWAWMEADGDLAFIRDEPRYKRMLAELKRKWPDRRKGKHSRDPKEFLK